MWKLRRLSLLFVAMLLAGCGVGEGTGSTPPWAHKEETPEAHAVTSSELAEEGPVEPIEPYHVRMETTQGDIVIAVHPEWAPRAAIRFKELVEAGFYDDVRVFRVVPGFVVQFGIHGDPDMHAQWAQAQIRDDPVIESNKRGTVTFATSGPESRTTQIFINLKDNAELDTMPENFAPFGEVIEGMDVAESFNSEYGSEPSDQQDVIASSGGGNEYLDFEFPNLDSIVKATVIDTPPADTSQATADKAAPDEATSDKSPPDAEKEDEPN